VVQVRLEPLAPYGENAIVWVPDGLDAARPFTPVPPSIDTPTEVTISDVRIGGENRTFTYEVTIFDPEGVSLANPGVPDFDGNGVPDLVWQNDATRRVTVNYFGGASGAIFQGWNWLNSATNGGWHVVAVADFNIDGKPDLVWQNDSSRQVTVNYYQGEGGAVLQGWKWLNTANNPGWHVVAAADFDGNGTPDLVWQNEVTRQVTVNYYGGQNGSALQGWKWLNPANNGGWSVVAASDFNGDGVPDLVWQNDATRQVTVHYFGGQDGSAFVGWNWLNAGSNTDWSVVAAADFNSDGVPDLVWQNDTTRQVTVHYYGGQDGSMFQGWKWLNMANNAGWSLVNSPRRR
jgi:hypothetical protein